MRDTTRTLGVGLVALILTLSVGFAGMGAMADGSQSATGDAQVRVAHMSPDAPPVDVLVDNQTVVSNVSYGNVTDYARLPAGEHNVSITAAGDPSAVVFSGNETFSADTNYTVAATGLISGTGDTAFEPVVYEDNFTAPGQGNASVRLVHVSPDAGPVDVTVAETNATLFDNVSFRNATAYEEVPAGNYTLEVRPATANDSGEVLKTFDVSLNERTVYSAFAAGYVNRSDVPAGSLDRPFDLILVTDFTAARNVTTTAAPAPTTANRTTVPPQTTTSVNVTTATPQTTTATTATTATTTSKTPNQTTATNRTNTSTTMNGTMATQTSTSKSTTNRTSTSESMVTQTSTSENVATQTSTSENMMTQTSTSMADRTNTTSTSK